MSTEPIPPQIKHVLDLPWNIKLYFYSGHAEDVCDPTTHKPITRRVPKGCIYITISECGINTQHSETRDDTLRSDDSDIKKVLQFPYIAKHKAQLAEYLDVDNINNIHIKYPGDEYVVSRFTPFAFWDREGTSVVGFKFSGVCEKSKLETLTDAQTSFIYDKTKSHFVIPNRELIVEKFTASIYPPIEKAREVMLNFKPNNPILTTRSLRPFDEELEKAMGVIPGISENDGPDAFLSNTYMMHEFPGIHYNLLCRYVSDDCRQEGILRRTPSGEAEIIRLDLPRQDLLEKKMLEDIGNEEEVVVATGNRGRGRGRGGIPTRGTRGMPRGRGRGGYPYF